MGNLILKYDVDKMYTFGFISLLIRLFFSYSDLLQIPGVVDMLLLLVFVACMLLVLIDEKLTGLQFFAVVITGAVCIYSYNKMDNYYLLATYFCMVASKNINLKYVLGWSYKVRVFMLTFHVAVYIFTLINNPNSLAYVYRDGVLRHSFFLSHANTFSMFLIWTIFEYLYVNYEKLTVRSMILVAVINASLNYFTLSTTNTIISVVVLLVILLDKLRPKWEMRSVRKFVKYAFAILSLFFCMITIYYRKFGGSLLLLYNSLNDFFTGRLIYGAYMYEKYGATFFGQTLKLRQNDYWNGYWFNGIACENAYIWHLVSFGVIYLLLLAFLFFAVADKVSRQDTIFLGVYILYAVTELYVTNAVLCFSLILLAQYAFQLDYSDKFQLRIRIRKLKKKAKEDKLES